MVSHHCPVILSEAKDPIRAWATTGSARSFEHGPAILGTGH
jgi:hypothetical protein